MKTKERHWAPETELQREPWGGRAQQMAQVGSGEGGPKRDTSISPHPFRPSGRPVFMEVAWAGATPIN